LTERIETWLIAPLPRFESEGSAVIISCASDVTSVMNDRHATMQLLINGGAELQAITFLTFRRELQNWDEA
jgi:hypothetical protein